MNDEEIAFAHKALDELEASNKQIKKLKAENAALRSELSAYKEGIEPEKADKNGHYIYIEGLEFFKVDLFQDGHWYYDDEFGDTRVVPTNGRLIKLPIPLPQQKEGI